MACPIQQIHRSTSQRFQQNHRQKIHRNPPLLIHHPFKAFRHHKHRLLKSQHPNQVYSISIFAVMAVRNWFISVSNGKMRIRPAQHRPTNQRAVMAVLLATLNRSHCHNARQPDYRQMAQHCHRRQRHRKQQQQQISKNHAKKSRVHWHYVILPSISLKRWENQISLVARGSKFKLIDVYTFLHLASIKIGGWKGNADHRSTW